MSKVQYHTNDCEVCAPLINAYEKKFGRQPNLNEFMVCFHRWKNPPNSTLEERIKRAEFVISELSFEELNKQASCYRPYT